MAKPAKPGLTRLETRVMQVLWKLGPATVAQVREQIDPPLAYTTVQTMLNILERKKKLRRELQGRAYVYTAALSEQKASSHALRDLIDRVFGGSSEDLVMSLLKSKQIDAAILTKLNRRLRREEES